MKNRSNPPRASGNGVGGARRGRPPTAAALEMQWQILLGQQEQLRDEIRRGEEYLARAQFSLQECRSQLEEWPTYERRCGADCLPHLTEIVLTNRRVERFLRLWLQRRKKQFAAVTENIDRFARTHASVVLQHGRN